VRAALALVATGEAPYGIVYATDAVAEPGVTVVGTFPDDSHPAIVYPAALLTGAADAADRAFFEALTGDAADAVFAATGFCGPELTSGRRRVGNPPGRWRGGGFRGGSC
jgi:molybdate transport system substrate-binding protein